MKGLTWPVVFVVLIAASAMVTLYLLVPEGDPIRGVIVTGVSGALSAATIYFLGRRQDQTDQKVDALVEATNGNGHGHEHPPSANGRPASTSPR